MPRQLNLVCYSVSMEKFAAFDIDGTLIRWQLYHTVVDRLAKAGHLGENAQDQLHEARMRWKRRESDDSFRDYEVALINVYENAVTTLDPAVFDSMLDDVLKEYQDQAYTYTRGLITKLKAEDYKLFAISGSHEELVAGIGRHYGFDDWVGTQYERVNGTYTGEKVVGSHDKRAALERLIGKHGLTLEGSYAIGDSRSDAPMLEMVENPIAFNPDQELLDIATAHRWPLVIERKNVVYELRDTGNGYMLISA